MPIGDRPTVILWFILGLAAAVANLSGWEQAESGRWWKRATSRWLLVVPACILLAALILFPSARQRNLSLIPAQQAIYEARTTGTLPAQKASQSVSLLQQAIGSNPNDPELYGMLGSLYAWQGSEEASIGALQQRMVLDRQDPLDRYAPFLKWRLQLAGEPLPEPSAGVLSIYKHWRNRFPDRAEAYVLTALVWQGPKEDGKRAATFLQAGLEKGAKPRELLLEFLNQVKTDD
jgi:hypothetical protein